jgi:FkbM family methyltransferase
MNASLEIAKLARKLTGNFVFRKKLPRTFGSARINVTSRSDIRLLAPGLHRSASDLLQVASLYIRPGSCVWDIGSNLGVFSFCASWKAGPQGRVYSLEADPFYVELQNKTVRLLPTGYSPVIPLCAAVADTMGIMNLCIPRRGHSRSHLASVEGNKAGETEALKQVVSVTADFLLRYWPKPDFVKVDIEGAEILFLRGATELLRGVRPNMWIEVCESNSDLATKLLSSFNYRMFTLAPDGSEQPAEKCKFNSLVKPSERL